MRAAKDQEKQRLAEEIEALDDAMPPPPPTIPATKNDLAKRTEIHVLKRGIWENKGEPVGPRPPSVLVPDVEPELPADVRDPRTRLARWLTSPEHPLTARVLVNRIWPQHFGVGLVKTVNDFGTQGDRPSHPELLDWLAASLVRERLATQAAPPADRAEQHLSPVGSVADRGGCPADRPGEPPALALQPAPADGRGNPRRHARRLGAVEPQDQAGRASWCRSIPSS